MLTLFWRVQNSIDFFAPNLGWIVVYIMMMIAINITITIFILCQYPTVQMSFSIFERSKKKIKKSDGNTFFKRRKRLFIGNRKKKPNFLFDILGYHSYITASQNTHNHTSCSSDSKK